MTKIKTNAEIALMKKSGSILKLVRSALKDAIKPGITPLELDKISHKIMLANKSKPSFLGYGGFPATICSSVNEVLVHGIPNNRPLQNGDIISIDIGVNYQGFHSDSAFTIGVGEISKQAQHIIDVTEKSLAIGLSVVKDGIKTGDIGYAIQKYVEGQGYHLPKDYTGHGIGRELHEGPYIPNYGNRHQGDSLKAGMTIAIEPMVQIETDQTETMADGWTVKSLNRKITAHFEHTILITKDGYELIT